MEPHPISKGVLSNDEISIERAKVCQSILELCEAYKNNEKKNVNINKKRIPYLVPIILVLLIPTFILIFIPRKIKTQELLKDSLDIESFDDHNKNLIQKSENSSFSISSQEKLSGFSLISNEAQDDSEKQRKLDYIDINSDALPDLMANSKENSIDISNTQNSNFSESDLNSINYSFTPNLTSKEYFDIGMSFNSINEYTKAHLNLSKAIQDSTNYLEAYLNRGVIKRKLFDYEGAIKDYSKALTIAKNNPVILINRSIVYARIEELDKAIDDCNWVRLHFDVS